MKLSDLSKGCIDHLLDMRDTVHKSDKQIIAELLDRMQTLHCAIVTHEYENRTQPKKD